MKSKLFDYVERDNFIYNLSGVTKLICFLFLTFSSMYAYDIRVVLLLTCFSFMLLRISQIRFSQIKMMFVYVFIFLLINFILTFLFSPQYGTVVYGTRHVLFSITKRYTVTQEQLLYQLTKISKYASVVPLGIIFILSTNPSEFAAAVTGIGIHYKPAYSVSLTLRYFPEMVRNYNDISVAQQARGIDMSKKASFSMRVKNTMNIFVPLIFSTLSRIEVITNAMDLRGFGKGKKRTWYMRKKLSVNDYLSMFFAVALFVLVVLFSQLHNHGRFWNPFVYGM